LSSNQRATKPPKPRITNQRQTKNKTIITHGVAVGKLQHRRLRELATNEPRLKQQQPPWPQQQ